MCIYIYNTHIRMNTACRRAGEQANRRAGVQASQLSYSTLSANSAKLYFLSEPAETAKSSPQPTSEGGMRKNGKKVALMNYMTNNIIVIIISIIIIIIISSSNNNNNSVVIISIIIISSSSSSMFNIKHNNNNNNNNDNNNNTSNARRPGASLTCRRHWRRWAMELKTPLVLIIMIIIIMIIAKSTIKNTERGGGRWS